MNIIGLTSHEFGNHDNSVALLVDGRIVFAESEERPSRVKHDRRFPKFALEHALAFSKKKLSQIDLFVSGSPPTPFVRMMWSYFSGISYCGVGTFVKWFAKRLLVLPKERRQKQASFVDVGIPKERMLFVSHQDAHATTAYWFSPFDTCLVVALDGYGGDLDGTPLAGKVYIGKDNTLTQAESIPVYASLALYYGAVTVALGFKLNDGEGKTMGLAAYGKPQKCLKFMREIFPDFKNGKWIGKKDWLDVNSVSRFEYFQTTPIYKQLRFLIERYGEKDVASAAQAVLEERSVRFFMYLVDTYNIRTVAAAGGMFLNVKMNMKLTHGVVDNLWVYPNPGDGGIAVGAALLGYQKSGRSLSHLQAITGLGCMYTNEEIERVLKSYKSKTSYQKLNQDTLVKTVAKCIDKGEVIGWFQGRGEWGPRALGHRSVLGDPRNGKIRKRINDIMKRREWFMPFAPSILFEHARGYFPHLTDSPFMIMADTASAKAKKEIKAAVHVDGTGRPQYVRKTQEPLYWRVIHEFFLLTGVPAVLNTSFNKHGLPIVHSPADAVDHLLWGAVDSLVIGNFFVRRKQTAIIKEVL